MTLSSVPSGSGFGPELVEVLRSSVPMYIYIAHRASLYNGGFRSPPTTRARVRGILPQAEIISNGPHLSNQTSRIFNFARVWRWSVIICGGLHS